MRLKRYTDYLNESMELNGLTKTDIELMLEDLTMDRDKFPEELEISLTQGKTARPSSEGDAVFSFSFVPRIEVKIKAVNPPRTFRHYGEDVRRFLLRLIGEKRFTEIIDNFRDRLEYYDLAVQQPVVPHNLDYILLVIRTKNEN
jgi:hypothetical protein